MNYVGLLLSVLLTGNFFADLGESREIIKKIDAFRIPFEQFLIKTRVIAYKEDKVKETALFDAYINGNNKSLVIEKEGKNRDMKILYVEKKMWVQLPASRRPIRITPIQRLIGQASNGDVAMVSYGENYTAEIMGKGIAQNIQCVKLLLTARDKSATYHKIILYVRQDSYRPEKAEFFLISGKHFKTAYYNQYMRIGKQMVLKKMTIFDELHKDQKTVFEYENIQEKKIAAKYYNKNYLIHVRGL